MPTRPMGYGPSGLTHPTIANPALVRREAVEESRPAGALEIVLAAAAVRTARWMRRIPRFRRVVVTQALAVDVAEHHGALRAARVILARAILAGREGTAVRL